ncbi:uncharacterized protein BDZ83DRAFT_748187 [Colletotrichum acutatum]|uniref:Uncharacterized protein n=1 Tax=Glomerella acutata TaxID=27357 RepID=A0AAD9CZL5_GLOAC|nr:uncharacterized protein BDZ83DRAFT_748187 [Colletotrichum acutatum]KAK1729412.1 hypothetical protein BDZ83DRAFT_748187 [Colletotrichum acutatum]
MLPPADVDDPAPLFFWAGGTTEPDRLFDNDTFDLFDEPEAAISSNRADFFMSQVDYEFALPVNEGQHAALWHPLETIISDWIQLIRMEKDKVTPHDTPYQFGSEQIGGRWEWRPYGDAQRQSQSGILLTPAVLDTASVPDGFARALPPRARRPRSRHVAPGLAVPPADAAKFTSIQRFAQKQQPGLEDIPPICLFPAAQSDLEADVTGSLGPFPDHSDLSRVHAGIYSESVSRKSYGNAEEGFWLLLPFSFQGYVGDEGGVAGARKSDRSFVEAGRVAELF